MAAQAQAAPPQTASSTASPTASHAASQPSAPHTPGTPRPAAVLMTPERLGAFWASPLSFSRSLLRDLARRGCTVAREAFALDERGEGHAIYRVTIGGVVLTYYVLSFSVPEEEKTDRVIGVKWDVMASLLAGPPSAARLAELRQELPKQKVGRAEADTLVWLRANKSVRAFRHTVERLAQGGQPDPAILLSTGYLLRTTAFYANGKLGTISFAGLRQLGVLCEPYHAQIMSAWLLREFSADLVAHLARAINPDAAGLSPEWRRMIGVGNSAGVGVVPFLLRHPDIIARWIRAQETMLGAARARPAAPDDAERLLTLLERAARYHDALPEQGSGFAPGEAVAADLRRAVETLRGMLPGMSPGESRVEPRFEPCFAWAALCDWAAENLGAEAQEALHVALLELFPDLVQAAQPTLTAGEEPAIDPGMRADALAARLAEKFAWVDDALAAQDRRDVFWYRSDEAGEPRIAERAGLDWSRREVFMDLCFQVRALREALATLPPDTRAADLLLRRPDLYEAVRRVQAGLDFGEIRANLVDGRLVALPLIRFVLAFYGMERFTPGSTRWVRGTLLQGAPTAADLAEGHEGDWPFPLGAVAPGRPQGAGKALPFRAEKQNLEGDGKRSLEIRQSYGYTLLPLDAGPRIRVAVPELIYLIEHALRWAGMPPGAAQKAAEIATTAEIIDGHGLAAAGGALTSAEGRDWSGLSADRRDGRVILRSAGLGLVNVAAYALETAAALATETDGVLEIEQPGDAAGLLPGLVWHLAMRGVFAVATIGLAEGGYGLAAALPSAQGTDLLLATVATLPHDVAAAGAPPENCLIRLSPDAGVAEALRAQAKNPSFRLLAGETVASQLRHADRFGLVCDRDLLAPVVSHADRVLLAPAEESAGAPGQTAAWGHV